jgi:hypothetical protein
MRQEYRSHLEQLKAAARFLYYNLSDPEGIFKIRPDFPKERQESDLIEIRSEARRCLERVIDRVDQLLPLARKGPGTGRVFLRDQYYYSSSNNVSGLIVAAIWYAVHQKLPPKTNRSVREAWKLLLRLSGRGGSSDETATRAIEWANAELASGKGVPEFLFSVLGEAGWAAFTGVSGISENSA